MTCDRLKACPTLRCHKTCHKCCWRAFVTRSREWPATIDSTVHGKRVRGEPSPYPVALGDLFCRDSKGYCSIPFGIPALAGMRTWRRLSSSRPAASHCTRPHRSRREGLWREHKNQGRCQPGRRAVLEENNVRLTADILPCVGRFLKPQSTSGRSDICFSFS